MCSVSSCVKTFRMTKQPDSRPSLIGDECTYIVMYTHELIGSSFFLILLGCLGLMFTIHLYTFLKVFVFWVLQNVRVRGTGFANWMTFRAPNNSWAPVPPSNHNHQRWLPASGILFQPSWMPLFSSQLESNMPLTTPTRRMHVILALHSLEWHKLA